MADDESDKAKKTAALIRGSTESNEIDLAGYGGEQCDRLAEAAFAKPLPLAHMIRLTFTVGGGKKVRQKYNDGLPALLADALRKVGFSEDRGASLDVKCAGLFKFQHNTDTDLKVTHVYPKIDPEAAAAASEGEGGGSVEALSPAELILFSEMPTFQRMIASKTPSLGQKRRALEALKEGRATISAAEEKLASMQALSEKEQHYYDTLDAAALEEKQSYLSKAMEAMIDKGQLTVEEKEAVLEQLSGKMRQLEEQLAAAESEKKAKRAEKLGQLLDDLRAKAAAARDAKPIRRPAKFEAEMKAVRQRLAALDKLEESSKKTALPLSEVQKLTARPKLQEDLAAMQAESRGWFAE
jgi:hypothetical protein